MVFSAKDLSLNRPDKIGINCGAKHAKEDGCWSVLILEEGSESEQTKPSGREGQAVEEGPAIFVVEEELATFDSPGPS